MVIRFAGIYDQDTVYGFANAFDFSLSAGVNTRLYGMYQFKKGPLIAIRHIDDTFGLNLLHTGFRCTFLGYYRPITNDTATVNPQKYSIFQGTIYGGPSGVESGLVNFSLANNSK